MKFRISLAPANVDALVPLLSRLYISGWGSPEALAAPLDLIFNVDGSHVAAAGMGQLNVPREILRIMASVNAQGTVQVT